MMSHHGELDQHYWTLVNCAEANLLLIMDAQGETSPQQLALRQVVALEQIALELHLARECGEAVGLGTGHRVEGS